MKLPRQLSYTRSLSPGKAVFFYKTPESDFEPLQIERQKIRGQKSGFAEAYKNEANPKELASQDLAFGNPYTIHHRALLCAAHRATTLLPFFTQSRSKQPRT